MLCVSFQFTGVPTYMPANGESVTITTVASVPVDISLNLLKRDSATLGSKFLCKFYIIKVHAYAAEW
jgi:hypothetical protein